MTNHYYGWKKDREDSRDLCYIPPEGVEALPSVVDLRTKLPPCYDQGQMSTCVGNGTAGACQFLNKDLGVPSRLFIYDVGKKVYEESLGEDNGMEIRDAIKTVATYGVPPETEWSYEQDHLCVDPPEEVYSKAVKDKALKYQSINQDLNSLKHVLYGSLLSEGHPIVMGMVVYQSFEECKKGNMPMPGWMFDKPLGGHCVLIVGYDDDRQVFIVRNSWGTSWGDNGYFYMPYKFALSAKYSSDFWVITKMEE